MLHLKLSGFLSDHSVSRQILDAEYICSIVAIHGLNGNARRTWLHPATGTMWLEDLLPHAFPNSRIMTFGYDATIAFSRSQAGLQSFAMDLLNRLRAMRVSSEVGRSS